MHYTFLRSKQLAKRAASANILLMETVCSPPTSLMCRVNPLANQFVGQQFSASFEFFGVLNSTFVVQAVSDTRRVIKTFFFLVYFDFSFLIK